jgi:hypothetical protein
MDIRGQGEFLICRFLGWFFCTATQANLRTAYLNQVSWYRMDDASERKHTYALDGGTVTT